MDCRKSPCQNLFAIRPGLDMLGNFEPLTTFPAERMRIVRTGEEAKSDG